MRSSTPSQHRAACSAACSDANAVGCSALPGESWDTVEELVALIRIAHTRHSGHIFRRILRDRIRQ
jgi:hypothetical protein